MSSFFGRYQYGPDQVEELESTTRAFKTTHTWVALSAILYGLEQRGVIDSFNENIPCKQGKEQPLLTLPFIDWFESHDFTNWNLIEIGSGNSTFYFSKYFKQVTSYETNKEWYLKTKDRLPDNVKYNLIDLNTHFPDYSNVSDTTMILIDCASSRLKVATNVMEKSRPGVVVLDNSDSYTNTSTLLTKYGYREIPFWGLKLSQHHESCTSIFIKDIKNLPNREYEFRSVNSRKIINNLWDT